jgi:anti-sigma regulatory factor (Ser/Thr protein kinase)
VEWQGHETLLNVAFADGTPWTVLYPYDVEALEPEVVEEAHRSHPNVVSGGRRQLSGGYVVAPPPPARLDQPLAAVLAGTEAMLFGPEPDGLKSVRALARRHATEAGLDAAATDDFVVAVNEVATNSLTHGGGRGSIRFWQQEGDLICEIQDGGHIGGPPLSDRQRPTADQVGGRGLWLVNQLCDLVQIRSTDEGTTVRLHMRIRSS